MGGEEGDDIASKWEGVPSMDLSKPGMHFSHLQTWPSSWGAYRLSRFVYGGT